ncbi:unnamed protein product, partial [Linum tenue]
TTGWLPLLPLRLRRINAQLRLHPVESAYPCSLYACPLQRASFPEMLLYQQVTFSPFFLSPCLFPGNTVVPQYHFFLWRKPQYHSPAHQPTLILLNTPPPIHCTPSPCSL